MLRTRMLESIFEQRSTHALAKYLPKPVRVICSGRTPLNDKLWPPDLPIFRTNGIKGVLEGRTFSERKERCGRNGLDKRLVKSEYSDEKRNLPEWKPGKTWLPRLDYHISGDSSTEALHQCWLLAERN